MITPHPVMCGRSTAMNAGTSQWDRFGTLQYLPRMFGSVRPPLPQMFHSFHESQPHVHCPLPPSRYLQGCANLLHREQETVDVDKVYANHDSKPCLKSPQCQDNDCNTVSSFSLPKVDHYIREQVPPSVSPQGEAKKTFLCPQCKYTTDRKNNLKRHIITMHFDCDRKLECCGSSFRSKAKLREHVTLFHKNGYRCVTCGRVFCRKALLRRHMTVHSGKKDYQCNICNYATSHKSNLERHQKVHKKFSSPSGIYLSRRFQLKSTTKLRKSFFDQYRQSIFNRSHIPDLDRTCESYTGNSTEHRNRDNTSCSSDRQYFKDIHTNTVAKKNDQNQGSETTNSKRNFDKAIQRQQTRTPEVGSSSAGKNTSAKEDSSSMELTLQFDFTQTIHTDKNTKNISKANIQQADSNTSYTLNKDVNEMLNKSVSSESKIDSGSFEQWDLEAIRKRAPSNKYYYKSNATARDLSQIKLPDHDRGSTTINLGSEHSDQEVYSSRDSNKTRIANDNDGYGLRQRVPRLRRRLCDKPYRCSSCCCRFEHQVASLQHICSHRNLQACLESLSIVSMMNRCGMKYGPLYFLGL